MDDLDWARIVDVLGYPSAGLGILIESAGVPFPGEALLLAAAAVERFGAFLRIKPEHLARAELFFARHGDKAVLAARFFLGLRTWGSMLAGMSRMPFWRFQFFSALGGFIWAVLIGTAGYVLGSNLPLLETIIRAIGIGGLTVLLLIVLILVVAQSRASRQR